MIVVEGLKLKSGKDAQITENLEKAHLLIQAFNAVARISAPGRRAAIWATISVC